MELVAATPEDAGKIRQLAESIWWQAYPSILPAGQIRFMLDWMYTPSQLASEIRGGQVHYELFRHEGEISGYSSQYQGEEPGEIHLSKFYLAIELHGRGLGSEALQALANQAREAGASCLTLRVNRHNQPALRCYLRNGFRITGNITTDIGSGYVMDDYWMRLDLAEEGAGAAKEKG
ncbi:MAG: GNAT family N-acetyltransferase [Verrucomicrobiales bacterium]